jgi:hypothetical protein
MTPAPIRIALFSSTGREKDVAFVEFTSLSTGDGEDCSCCPENCLAPAEIRELADELRQSPDVQSGRIGRYLWLRL